MAVLARGIDELDVELLSLPRLRAGEDRFAENDGSLFDASDTALKEHEVLVDATVVREATHGCDVLVDGISLACRVIGSSTVGSHAHTVDLLVDLGSAVITLLTTASNSPLDGRRMPGTDTGDLSQTSMRLTVKSGAAESLDRADHTLTTGDADSVDHLIVSKEIADTHFLLEFIPGEINFVVGGASVDLDLHDVCLVLTQLQLADLSGHEHTHDGAVLLYALEVA